MSHTQKIVFSELKHKIERCARSVNFMVICEKLYNFMGTASRDINIIMKSTRIYCLRIVIFPLLQEHEEICFFFFCFHIDPAE